MPSVSVLYIEDAIVGPHLELLRSVCEPKSNSRPHITVRYFDKLEIPPEYLSCEVDHVDVLYPGSFGLENEWTQRNRTVFLRCESDQLLGLEHKPHFPTSFFHITLYDGRDEEFASSLLHVVNSYDWHFRVPLPPCTELEKVEINTRRFKRRKRRRPYPPAVKALFLKITGAELKRRVVDRLSPSQRLDIAAAVCENLMSAVAGFERVPERLPPAHPDAPSEGPTDAADVHLTPPELAREVAAYAVELLEPSKTPIDFGDPAVGNGVFFAALLRCVERDRIRSAIGIDINEQQVEAANHRWASKGMEVLKGDYLHMNRLPARSLILANPPYRRHQDIPAEYKLALRERASIDLGLKISGQAGLYVYFLLVAHEWMASGAVAAWLLPAEFMQTNYGAAVRHYLTHQVRLVRIHRFDHQQPQFENAKVLPAVVVFVNESPSPEHEVMLSEGGTLRSPISCETAPVADLRVARTWSLRQPRVNLLAGNPTIGDLFTVQRGIATGANSFFMLERAYARQLGIPDCALTPILPKARALPSDIVDSGPDGFPAVSPQMCVIDTAMPLSDIQIKYPAFAAYLNQAQDLGVLNRTLVKARHPWYKQERRSPSPFLSTYMGRGRDGLPPIRFIWNRSRAIATNTYLLMHPRPAVAAMLARRPEREEELFLLLQQTAREAMHGFWRMHAGGLMKIEPSDLLLVPLAGVPAWLPDVVEPAL